MYTRRMPEPSRRDARASLQPHVVGRFAQAALAAGAGEVCAVLRRSFYLRSATGYACVGDASLGRGPLNALVATLAQPAVGERVEIRMDGASTWQPAPLAFPDRPDVAAFAELARARAPSEGLACLVGGGENALASHAQPALDALHGWLAGHGLASMAQDLVGLGPGPTPAGDDYLGGVLVALRAIGRAAQAESLWRWLEPRLAARTSALSAAHLAAAAAGEAHEGVHACLAYMAGGSADGQAALARLDAAGDLSPWDALAGALAVLRTA